MGRFSADTTDRAERVQIRAHAAPTPEERYALAVEMSDNLRDIALDGLRRRRPGVPEPDLMREFLERIRGWRLPGGRPRGLA